MQKYKKYKKFITMNTHFAFATHTFLDWLIYHTFLNVSERCFCFDLSKMNFRFMFLFLETVWHAFSYSEWYIYYIIYTYVVIVIVVYGTTSADINTYVWYIYCIYCMYVCQCIDLHSQCDALYTRRPIKCTSIDRIP